MKDRRVTAIGAFLGFALLAGIGSVSVDAQNAQQTAQAAPNARNAQNVQVMMSDIGLPGWVNVIKATVEPGNKSNPHSHAGRIAIQIITEGTAVEHRGDQVITHNNGEFYSVPIGSEHWFENTGTVPMSYVEVNIRSTPPPAAPAAPPAVR